MTVIATLDEFCQQNTDKKTYWIAYSGGMDSHVLLTACCEMRTRYAITLRAIHINHGLSAKAALWAKHCARVCAIEGIPYYEFTINIVPYEGMSIEETARSKRYAIFAEQLAPNDVLLTAHHQDDQAETVLLQLLRGAGPKGLAAMPQIKPLGRGIHFRPFLNEPRAALEVFAIKHALKWIEDESNSQTNFARNFIRHQVLPLFKNRWATIENTLARSAAHCAEAQALLEEFAATIEKQVRGAKSQTLSVTKLLSLPSAKQKLVLRYWISSQKFPLPDTKKILSILKNVLTAKRDKTPCVRWDGAEVRRYRDDLHLMPALIYHDPTQSYLWQLTQPLDIPVIGVLKASSQNTLSSVSAKVAFRQGGESIRLPKRGSRTIKHMFQEWGIPPWERDRIPLVYMENKLVCVPGCWVDPTLDIQFVLQSHANVKESLIPLPQAGEV